MKQFFDVLIILAVCVLLTIVITAIMSVDNKTIKSSDLSPPSSKDVMIDLNNKRN